MVLRNLQPGCALSVAVSVILYLAPLIAHRHSDDG